MENQSEPFGLAINMSGANSAGAHTASVLDFLMEALRRQIAKHSFRQPLAGRLPTAQNVLPLHYVSIDAFIRASAKHMCAAISTAFVQGHFQLVRTGDEPRGYAQPTNLFNRFYDSRANRIDFKELLKTDDLDEGRPLVSLLGCTIFHTTAANALTLPKQITPRPYVNHKVITVDSKSLGDSIAKLHVTWTAGSKAALIATRCGWRKGAPEPRSFLPHRSVSRTSLRCKRPTRSHFLRSRPVTAGKYNRRETFTFRAEPLPVRPAKADCGFTKWRLEATEHFNSLGM